MMATQIASRMCRFHRLMLQARHIVPGLNSVNTARPCNVSQITFADVDHHKIAVSIASDHKELLCMYCSKRTYKTKSRKYGQDDDSSDSDSNSEYDDSDEEYDETDDSDAPKNYKLMAVVVKSLRVDSIVSKAFDIARNRVDELFFSNKLRFNGESFEKKSRKLSPGDFVDMVTGKSEDTLNVKRVKLVKIMPDKTRSDKFNIKIKVWRAPFKIENTVKTSNTASNVSIT